MTTGVPNAVFEVIDPSGTDDGGNIAGLWVSKPTPRKADLAFSTASTTGRPDLFSWRANLPSDRLLAAASLSMGEAKVDRYIESLDTTADYFDRVAAGEIHLWEKVSHSTIISPELRALMLPRATEKSGAVDFGALRDLSDSWSQIWPQVAAFVSKIQRLLSQYASVETLVGGKLIARTLVTWVGDNHTLWTSNAGASDARLHQRNLLLSLKSKDAWVQTFVLIAQSTAKISLLLASGAGVLALPATWRLVQDLLAQAETLRKILSEKSQNEGD